MGSWLGGKPTVSKGMMFAPSGCRHIGVSPSIQPTIANQDLRHPNPVCPVFSDPTGFSRAPTRESRRSAEAPGRPSNILAVRTTRAATRDQRIALGGQMRWLKA